MCLSPKICICDTPTATLLLHSSLPVISGSKIAPPKKFRLSLCVCTLFFYIKQCFFFISYWHPCNFCINFLYIFFACLWIFVIKLYILCRQNVVFCRLFWLKNRHQHFLVTEFLTSCRRPYETRKISPTTFRCNSNFPFVALKWVKLLSLLNHQMLFNFTVNADIFRHKMIAAWPLSFPSQHTVPITHNLPSALWHHLFCGSACLHDDSSEVAALCLWTCVCGRGMQGLSSSAATWYTKL